MDSNCKNDGVCYPVTTNPTGEEYVSKRGILSLSFPLPCFRSAETAIFVLIVALF